MDGSPLACKLLHEICVLWKGDGGGWLHEQRRASARDEKEHGVPLDQHHMVQSNSNESQAIAKNKKKANREGDARQNKSSGEAGRRAAAMIEGK